MTEGPTVGSAHASDCTCRACKDHRYNAIELHPVQVHTHPHKPPMLNAVITRRAYEVYRELYGDQPAMVTGGCRGGFGAAELFAFLYARTFPKNEWRARFDEALRRSQGL